MFPESKRKNIPNKEYRFGIFLDFNKSFDTIDLDIVLNNWNIMQYVFFPLGGFIATCKVYGNLVSLIKLYSICMSMHETR